MAHSSPGAATIETSSSRRRARAPPPVPYQKRTRARKNQIPAHVEKEAERSHQSTPVPPFGHRRFATFVEFVDEWAQYTTTNFVKTRFRQSATRDAYNERIETKYNEDLKKPHALRQLKLKEPDLLPAYMSHYFMTADCTHGCFQESRGPEKKKQIRYRKCGATIIAQAVKGPDGRWIVETCKENPVHSHECTPLMLYTVQNVSELVVAHNLLSLVKVLVTAKTPTRRICDIVSRAINRVFTAQHLANFKRDKLKLNEPLANLRVLLQRFKTFKGSDVLLVKDEMGKVCALGLQSPAQREYFRRYGDNLVMNLTYNTNNYRFNFGALMVTSPTGCGVSVFDFLCINQTKKMLSKLLHHFVAVNEGAALKPKSVVIDKDLAEWKVLEKVFPRARIILCKFHVIRRFDTVIDDADYGVPVPMRDRVRKICSEMVYARTSDAMDAHVDNLEGLLGQSAPQFITYFRRNWSDKFEMWSDFARGDVFSALNGTTNRIESSWGEFKKHLGSDRTIDHWFESLYAFSTAVLNRELNLIIKRVYRLLLAPDVDPFMVELYRSVSDYVAAALKEERHLSATVDYTVDDAGDTFHVWRPEQGAQRYRVRRDGLKCTCTFAISSGMPCRHAFVVAEKNLKLETFPLAALADRWRLDLAADMIPSLQRWIGELQTVRLAKIDFGEATDVDDSELGHRVAASGPANVTVVYVKLRKGEKTPKDLIVLDDLEKRSRVRRQLDPVSQYLMVLPMPKYTRLKAELDAALSALLTKWTVEDDTVAVAQPVFTTTELDLPGRSYERHISLHDAIGDDDVYDWSENGTTDGVPVIDHDQWARAMMVGTDETTSAHAANHEMALTDSVAGPDVCTQRVWLEAAIFPGDLPTREFAREHRDGDVGQDPDVYTQRSWFQSMIIPSDVSETNSLANHDGLLEGSGQGESGGDDLVDEATSRFVHSHTDEPEQEPDVYVEANDDDCYATPPAHEDGAVNTSASTTGVDMAPPTEYGARTGDDNDGDVEISGIEFATRAQPRTRGQRTSKSTTRPLAVIRLRRPLDELLGLYRHTKPISLVLDYMGRVRVPSYADELENSEITITTQRSPSGSAVVYDVLGDELVARMTRALQSTSFGGAEVDIDDEVVFDFGVGLPRITGGEHQLFVRFYAIRDKIREYNSAVAWLQDPLVWGGGHQIEYLRARSDDATPFQIARNATTLMRLCSLDTKLVLNTTTGRGSFSVRFADTLGHVFGDTEVNDAVLMFSLRLLATDFNGVHVFDTAAPSPTVPRGDILNYSRLIFPVFYARHWCVVCVTVSREAGIEAQLYNRLGVGFATLRRTWRSKIEPALRQWWQVSGLHAYPDPIISEQGLPTQRDALSCGVFCFAKVVDFLHNGDWLQGWNTIPPATLSQLRLWMAWRMLFESSHTDESTARNDAVKFQAEFDLRQRLSNSRRQTIG